MDTDVNDTSSPLSDASKATSAKKTSDLNVKFEFRTTKSDFDFAAIHREIAMTVANKYADSIFFTNHIDHPIFDPFSNNDNEMDQIYNYHLLPRTNHFVACFAHRISSSATFDDIKQLLKNILSSNKGFIRINKWNEKDIDIVNAGWILYSNPTIHHRDQLLKQIEQSCEQKELEFVPIQLQSRSIRFNSRNSNQRIKTDAIHILCRNDDLGKCRTLLQTIYSDTKLFCLGSFVPSNITTTQGASALQKLILAQQHYLDNHRSITLLGVSYESLSIYTTDDKDETLLDIIQKCPWVDWITTTTRTNTQGRIIFSTTVEKYYSAIDWIDAVFIPKHHNLDLPTTFSAFDDQSHRLVKGQKPPQSDVYSKNLIAQVNSVQINTPSFQPNAWNKPLTIQPRSPTVSDDSNTTSSNTVSDMTSLTNQIESLVQSINKLQSNVQQQLDNQNKIINNIDNLIDISVNKHLLNIQENIDAMKSNFDRTIRKLNDSWIEKFKSIQIDQSAKSTTPLVATKTPHTPKTVGFRNANNDPDSGSNRVRKQPRTTTNLDLVQKNLFQSGITQTTTNNNTSSESHHKNE